MIPSPPLWLPEGSIRALLALMVVSSVLWGVSDSPAEELTQLSIAKLGLAGLVLHHYFKVRSDETSTQPPTEGS